MKLRPNKPLRTLGIYTLRDETLILVKHSKDVSFLFSQENWNLHGPIDYRISHGVIYRRGQDTGLTDQDLVDTGKTSNLPTRSTFLNEAIDRKTVLTSSVSFRNELLKEVLSIPGLGSYLLPQLQLVSLTVNQVLYEQGDQIHYLYFPLDSIISGVAIMEDGTTIETSMVGCDGLVGLSAILGSGASRQWIWVTISGSAIQVESACLEKLFFQNQAFIKVLLRYYRSLIIQISQRCVCNTRHTTMERLSCWLLMLHDRLGETSLNLTQEMIANRVGVRRAGITVAAGMLQEMKAIKYRRGQVHIENREALKRAVCECYSIMQTDLGIFPWSGFEM